MASATPEKARRTQGTANILADHHTKALLRHGYRCELKSLTRHGIRRQEQIWFTNAGGRMSLGNARLRAIEIIGSGR